MIKAVIYDLDDLMVNSDPIHILAWEMLLKEFNHSFSEIPLEIRTTFIGKRIIDISKDIITALKIETDFDSFYKKRINLFLQIVRDKLEAMPGLIQSINLFKSKNLKIALASSGERRYIDLVLDKFNIRNYYDVIVSGDSVKKGKPDPETYLVACEKLGYKPEDCVVLEDAKNGIESAKSAGCKCIAIINLNTPVQDHSKADLILNSLLDVSMDKINSL
jgi:HAD superfamily hydrolase (TIGR01509 family)